MQADRLLDPTAPRQGTGLISFDTSLFRSAYDRRPFLVQHSLVGHPLFEMGALSALAERQGRKGDSLHWSGQIPVDTDFDHAYENHATGTSLQDTLARIGEANSFVALNYPESDPIYAPLIRQLYDDLRVGSEPLDPCMTEIMAYVFISSPHTITPYHMDRELNFLLQIQGRKLVHLWDPRDRAIMTERQVERLFAEPGAPRPGYKQEFQSAAQVYELTPGMGVHHPFIAPHWVKNGPEVSVSLALTYRTRASQRVAQAYQTNAGLRRLGLSPRPVGERPRGDRIKANAYAAVRDSYRWLQGTYQRQAARLRVTEYLRAH
jgi:hypothetical protein